MEERRLSEGYCIIRDVLETLDIPKLLGVNFYKLLTAYEINKKILLDIILPEIPDGDKYGYWIPLYKKGADVVWGETSKPLDRTLSSLWTNLDFSTSTRLCFRLTADMLIRAEGCAGVNPKPVLCSK